MITRGHLPENSSKKVAGYLTNFKEKIYVKKGLGNAHQALCSTFLQTSYSTIAATLRFLTSLLT
jgi:hypothetical protein